MNLEKTIVEDNAQNGHQKPLGKLSFGVFGRDSSIWADRLHEVDL